MFALAFAELCFVVVFCHCVCMSESSPVCCGQDLSLYINEVKRDRETIEQIEGIEKRSVNNVCCSYQRR